MGDVFGRWIMAALLALPVAALAQPAAEVAGLNPPAFLVRDGITRALDAGTELVVGDVVQTGEGGRLLLRLAEGSDVKLGSGAEFVVEAFEQREDGVFSGLLGVLRGAFRFTTTLLSRDSQRDLQVRVATVTAGIRGTDLWGRSNDESDLVCLIEGAISVSHEATGSQLMSEPLSFFVAPRGETPGPIGQVDPDQLSRWAAETELLDGQGVMRSDGAWTLHLASLRDADAAAGLQTALAEAGYAAVTAQVDIDGASWTRISLDGFATRAEALAAAGRLRDRFALTSPWAQAR